VKVSEIEVEKKEEKPETKVEKECCSKKCPETSIELVWK
jgi:hypothetical protein